MARPKRTNRKAYDPFAKKTFTKRSAEEQYENTNKEYVSQKLGVARRKAKKGEKFNTASKEYKEFTQSVASRFGPRKAAKMPVKKKK